MGRKLRESVALDLNEETVSRRRLVSSVKYSHQQGNPPGPGHAQLIPAFVLKSLLTVTPAPFTLKSSPV